MDLFLNIAAHLRLLHKSCSRLNKRDGSFKGKDWLGRYGELVAASYLRAHGCKILRQNFRVGRSGELDIVCCDEGVLCFVEVKTRSSDFFGAPARAVTFAKRRLIRKGAYHWLSLLRKEVPYRFDIVEVLVKDGVLPEIRVLKGAFGEKEEKRYSENGYFVKF